MTPETRVPAAAESYPTFWDDFRVPASETDSNAAPELAHGDRTPDELPDDDATAEHVPLDLR